MAGGGGAVWSGSGGSADGGACDGTGGGVAVAGGCDGGSSGAPASSFLASHSRPALVSFPRDRPPSDPVHMSTGSSPLSSLGRRALRRRRRTRSTAAAATPIAAAATVVIAQTLIACRRQWSPGARSSGPPTAAETTGSRSDQIRPTRETQVSGAEWAANGRAWRRMRRRWSCSTRAQPRPYRSRTARATVLFPEPEFPRRMISRVAFDPIGPVVGIGRGARRLLNRRRRDGRRA